MTVLSQQTIANANITNAGDIAAVTPSLTTNNRFGYDLTSFAIRGFIQELRTTSSVGVYFADVVSPRGSNSQVSGDGAGPGMFFDLENIQVLKGPQGTLFGRNTTGGSVLIVPKKPTEEFEGYIEASTGNYDLQQLQGVVNLPINDRVRLRLGIDQKKREGFLNNVEGIGPKDLADVDYVAGRASLVVDVTDDIENYSILTYTESENNGSLPRVTHCNTSGQSSFGGFIGGLCQAQLDRLEAAGHTGFWDITQNLPNPRSELEEMRFINTTTWEASDELTFKNIISYATLNTVNNSAIWGTNYQFAPFAAGGATIPYRFAHSGARGDGVDITDSSTFTEEFQIQGTALDERLSWIAGAYYEKTKPENPVGQSSPSNIACDLDTVESGNPDDWRCNDIFGGLALLGLINGGVLPPEAYGNEAAYLGVPLRVGSVSLTTDDLTYTNKGLFVQGTYDINDQLSTTLGLRYTWDETNGSQQRRVFRFPYDPLFGSYFAPEFFVDAAPKNETAKSNEPTWVLGLDYKPNEDTLLYAKYSRGYRQGSVNASSQPGLLVSQPEQVDTYEIGAKLTFTGAIPGNFNAALFYNDFQDQQIQNGILLSQEFGGVGSTAIVNAGKSEIQGLEVEANFELFDGFITTISYTYLDTEVKELKDFSAIIAATGATPSSLSADEGDELPFTPENSLVVSANYRLPIAEELGEMIIGATYIYNDEMRASATSTQAPLNVLPDYDLVNLNFNWRGVGGSPVDLSLFATNVTDEEYYTYSTGSFNTLESETGLPGMPRMYGARLRYNFGAN